MVHIKSDVQCCVVVASTLDVRWCAGGRCACSVVKGTSHRAVVLSEVTIYTGKNQVSKGHVRVRRYTSDAVSLRQIPTYQFRVRHSMIWVESRHVQNEEMYLDSAVLST